jgi:O-6-methylguanine DNA methyltransferase
MNDVQRDLRRLGGVQAPEGFEDRVLLAVGVVDHYAELQTPIGPFQVVWSNDELVAVQRSSPAFEPWLREFRRRPMVREDALPEPLDVRLRRALAGDTQASLKFDLRRLTEFERMVLEATLRIPYGEVRPYSWVAREMGRPRAVRAVGNVLAHNPIPLFIPCHRVVRSDGHMGIYSAGGEEAKRTLLDHEGLDVDRQVELARRGRRFMGSDTTHVFCFPSCHHARRITRQHQVTFHTAAEAMAEGYRPCAECRPALAVAV